MAEAMDWESMAVVLGWVMALGSVAVVLGSAVILESVVAGAGAVGRREMEVDEETEKAKVVVVER